MANDRELEMAWSDSIFPLKDFIELYQLPQMVQVCEGWYGEAEEAIEVSQGDVLLLHTYKETSCFVASTEYGKKVNIPLNLTKKVYVYYEKSLKDVKSKNISPERLRDVFPHKYSSVRLQCDLKNCLDKKDIYQAGDTLQVVKFDVSRKQLVCLNKRNFYVNFKMSKICHLMVTDATIDPILLADVPKQFKLPLTVRFVQHDKLPGLIHLKEIVTTKMVVATLGNEEYQSLLTFPSTLDITISPPAKETMLHPEYCEFVNGINKGIHMEGVHEELKGCEMYETVEELNIKAVPYSVFNFKKLNIETDNIDDNDYEVIPDDTMRPINKKKLSDVPHGSWRSKEDSFKGNDNANKTYPEVPHKSWQSKDSYKGNDDANEIYAEVPHKSWQSKNSYKGNDDANETYPEVPHKSLQPKDSYKGNDDANETYPEVPHKSWPSKDSYKGNDDANEIYTEVPHKSWQSKDFYKVNDDAIETYPEVPHKSWQSKDSYKGNDDANQTYPEVPHKSWPSKDSSKDIDDTHDYEEMSNKTLPPISKKRKPPDIPHYHSPCQSKETGDFYDYAPSEGKHAAMDRSTLQDKDRPSRSNFPSYSAKRHHENIMKKLRKEIETFSRRQSEDDEEMDSEEYMIPKGERRTEPLVKKVEDFTVNEICNFLKDLNLSQYCDRFRKEQVDGKMLRDLDEETLKSHFKMSSFHTQKLKKAVNENWRPSVGE